ncbi:chloroplast envelope membrane protein-like isoform X2 [Phragmites australis]|uniref:chloroplast envelope membrane protein-like isoform X2 n=1 Tax=Phragmites australis TaxID=29695 RepID=UPI002D79688A|nr:chloroplast envelope membrane protein-like isoform X2 [Phragmites australis]
MTFMSCSAVSSSGIALRLLIEERIRRRGACACDMLALGSQRRRVRHPVVFAKKRMLPKRWQRPWWKTFFSDWNDDEESLSGWREDGELLEEIGSEKELSENEKFETWKRKAEAIVELREAQQDAMNAEERSWEDWISGGSTSGGGDWGGDVSVSDQITDDPAEIVRDKSFIEVFRDSIDEDYDDMLFEDRVFLYASTNSAKFLALLIVVPWVIDFLVHDYVMMPFLERYVQKVPLAAELLDVRRSQKLQMVKDLKIEKARYRFEVEIGKSPPLSDEEVWTELREKAIELRDEWRLENRKAFANIWSDVVYGVVLFVLICFNQSKVAMLKFTGYKLLNNISDSGKAFLIILVSDILLGSPLDALLQVPFRVRLAYISRSHSRALRA